MSSEIIDPNRKIPVLNTKLQEEALRAILPYCMTEAEVLDYASLNGGQSSGFGVASLMVRKALETI